MNDKLEEKIHEEIRRKVITRDKEIQQEQSKQETTQATIDALADITVVPKSEVERIADSVRNTLENEISLFKTRANAIIRPAVGERFFESLDKLARDKLCRWIYSNKIQYTRYNYAIISPSLGCDLLNDLYVDESVYVALSAGPGNRIGLELVPSYMAFADPEKINPNIMLMNLETFQELYQNRNNVFGFVEIELKDFEEDGADALAHIDRVLKKNLMEGAEILSWKEMASKSSVQFYRGASTISWYFKSIIWVIGLIAVFKAFYSINRKVESYYQTAALFNWRKRWAVVSLHLSLITICVLLVFGLRKIKGLFEWVFGIEPTFIVQNIEPGASLIYVVLSVYLFYLVAYWSNMKNTRGI